MLNEYLKFNPKYDFIIKLAISLVLTCCLGPLSIQTGEIVPITLQTLFLLFSSIAFGWQVGALNAFMYILLGMTGLPVFSGYTGGHELVYGASGGFFFGFIGAALITGFIAEMPWAKKPYLQILNWFLGHAIILVLGAYWLKKFLPDVWWENIKPILPGAAIKSAFGFMLIQLIIRLLAGRDQFYNTKQRAS